MKKTHVHNYNWDYDEFGAISQMPITNSGMSEYAPLLCHLATSWVKYHVQCNAEDLASRHRSVQMMAEDNRKGLSGQKSAQMGEDDDVTGVKIRVHTGVILHSG